MKKKTKNLVQKMKKKREDVVNTAKRYIYKISNNKFFYNIFNILFYNRLGL